LGILLKRAQTSGLANPSPWLIDTIGAGASATGISVSEAIALNSTAVWACVKILAETVGTLPLPLYRRTTDGKERATDHPLYTLLHDLPNPEMTSTEVREAMVGSLMLWGNAYAYVERNGADEVTSFWPLRPERMRVWRVNGTGILQYQYSLYNGGVAYLTPHEIHHIRTFSADGIKGYGPINQNKEAIGLDIALQQFAASLFGNGATPGGVLTHPGELSKEARERVRESWEESHKGLNNAHRVAILEEGLTWGPVSIPPEAAQFLGTRLFQINEVARIWRIPPHLLGELTRSTNNNIEHQGLEFVIHTIRPICVRWEQAIARDLLHEDERAIYFAEFNVDGLLRGDQASRYGAYAIGRQWGFLSVNDIRDRENLNPIGDEGDIYLQPINMMDASNPLSPLQLTAPADGTAGEPGAEDVGNSANGDGADGARAAFHGLFLDAAGKAIKREEADVMRVIRAKKGDALSAALDKVYGDYAEYLDRQFGPLCVALEGLSGAVVNAPLQTSEREVRALLVGGAGPSEIQAHFDAARQELPLRMASSVVLAPRLEAPSTEDRLIRTLEAMASREIPTPVVNFHANAIKTEIAAPPPAQVTIAEGAIRSSITTPAVQVTISEGAVRAGDVHVSPPNLTISEGAIKAGDTHIHPAPPVSGKRRTKILKDRTGEVIGTETEEV